MSLAAKFWKPFSPKVLDHARWSLVERAAGFGLNFVSLVVLIRLISREDYGRWMFFLAIVSLVELYKATAITSAFLFHASREPEALGEVELWARRSSKLWVMWILLFCLVASLCSYVCGRHTLSLFFAVYPLWSYLLIGQTLAMARLQVLQKFRRAALLRVFLGGTSLVSTAALAFVPGSLRALVLPVFVCGGVFAGSAVARLFCRREAKPEQQPGPPLLDSLRSYTRSCFATVLCSSLYRSSDLLMIGFFRDPILLAFYTVALKLTDLIELPLQAATPIVMARVSCHSQAQRSRWISRLFLRTCAALCGICLPASIAFVVAPGWILRWIAGEKYLPAASTLAVFGGVALMRPVDRMAGVFLDAVGRPGDNFRKTLLLTMVNITANSIALVFVAGKDVLPWIAAVSVLALVVSTGFGLTRLARLGWISRAGLPLGRILRGGLGALLVTGGCLLLGGCASVTPTAPPQANPTESQKLVRKFPPCDPRPQNFPSDFGHGSRIPSNWAEWVMGADDRDLVLLALTNHPSSFEAAAESEKNRVRLDIEKKSWLAPFGVELNAGRVLAGHRGSASQTLVEGLATFKSNLQRELTYNERVRQFELERDVAQNHEDVVRSELAWNVRRRLEALRGAVRLLRVRSESLESDNLQQFYAENDFRAGVASVYEYSNVSDIANKAREAYLISLADVRVFKSDLEEALGMTVEEAYRLRFGKKPEPLKLESLSDKNVKDLDAKESLGKAAREKGNP